MVSGWLRQARPVPSRHEKHVARPAGYLVLGLGGPTARAGDRVGDGC
jgi:hypothetical protein